MRRLGWVARPLFSKPLPLNTHEHHWTKTNVLFFERQFRPLRGWFNDSNPMIDFLAGSPFLLESGWTGAHWAYGQMSAQMIEHFES